MSSKSDPKAKTTSHSALNSWDEAYREIPYDEPPWEASVVSQQLYPFVDP